MRLGTCPPREPRSPCSEVPNARGASFRDAFASAREQMGRAPHNSFPGKKRTGPPNRGAGSSIELLGTKTYFLIVRVADLAFAQSAGGVPTLVLGARDRYLPGLPAVLAEYDPVALVVALFTVFQPPPFFFFWILTGTASTQAVKGVVSVEETFPLA